MGLRGLGRRKLGPRDFAKYPTATVDKADALCRRLRFCLYGDRGSPAATVDIAFRAYNGNGFRAGCRCRRIPMWQVMQELGRTRVYITMSVTDTALDDRYKRSKKMRFAVAMTKTNDHTTKRTIAVTLIRKSNNA